MKVFRCCRVCGSAEVVSRLLRVCPGCGVPYLNSNTPFTQIHEDEAKGEEKNG